MIKLIIKYFTLIILTFIIGLSFVGQNLIINAVDPFETPTTTPSATGTATAPKPSTAPTSTKSDGPSIGSLKACVVDNTQKDITSKNGNKIIQDCLKSVINLVITLAVLISIASLVGYGIQLMNPLEESGKINGQIVERIKSLAIGGLILGSFGTILATINPATLTSNQILGQSAIDTFRSYISSGTKTGAVKTPVAGGGGTGATTVTGGNIDPILKSVTKTDGSIDVTKITAANKPKLIELVSKNDQCTNIFADSTCDSYAPIPTKTIDALEVAGVSSTYKEPAEIAGPIILKYDSKIVKDATSGLYTTSFSVDGKQQKATFKLRGSGTAPCSEADLDLGNTATAGKTIVPKGCTLVN